MMMIFVAFTAFMISYSVAIGFKSQTREEIGKIPLKTKLQLLSERGFACDDCSEEEVNAEVFLWQNDPVKKMESAPKQRKEKTPQDEDNIREVLDQLRNKGFGKPSSFVKRGDMDGLDVEDMKKTFERQQQKAKRMRK